MLSFLRKIFPERSPLRLLYHKISAVFAAVWFRFPGHRLTVIGVTGTSGKSTTVELIWYILNASGHKTGALSSIQFHIGDEVFSNISLRTSLRPWKTQKWLRRMVKEKCQYAVIEISSHAIDQHRHWGIGIDTAVMTNVFENEHIDYHKTIEDYVQTKLKLFQHLNLEYRKPKVSKNSILNRDSQYFDLFSDTACDHLWSYSYRQKSDFRAENIDLHDNAIAFDLRIPNNHMRLSVPVIGMHNLENTLAAIATASAQKVSIRTIADVLQTFPGAPARLQRIDEGQPFTVLLDYTYKPSALKSVLKTLKDVTDGRLIVVWGGAGGRSEDNWAQSAEMLHLFADEIVLTTDDPYDVDPQHIVDIVRQHIPREETGNSFFEISDRYEAIRYALFSAEEHDLVLVAGRGHEKIQTLGKTKIPFEDEKVVREILRKL